MTTTDIVVATTSLWDIRKVAEALGVTFVSSTHQEGSVGYSVVTLETEPEPVTGYAAAKTFAEGLAEKFGDPTFAVSPGGRKFHKITHLVGSQEFVHAFVEDATGHVHKAAAWSHPVKSPAYDSVNDALKFADKYGGYLYANEAKKNRAL